MFGFVISLLYTVSLKMNEDESGAGGGAVFVAREDLVQALITLGVTRNAALRVSTWCGNIGLFANKLF